MLQYACQPFVTAADVVAWGCLCDADLLADTELINDMIDEASDMLYLLSNGVVSGRCLHVLRPVRVFDFCGQRDGIEIDALPLPGPMTDVVEVVINGAVLAPSEYRLLDGNLLIRADGKDWPDHNKLHLADSEDDTWSVSVRFGYPVSRLVERATLELVCAMLRSEPSLSKLRGVTSATIQGASVQFDPSEVSTLGLPNVSRLLDKVTPMGMLPSAVWSPDGMRGWMIHEVFGPSGS